MSKLKIYSSALAELHTIDSVITCSRMEAINSDNTLTFSMFLNDENKNWINDTNVIGLDGDYFDIAHYKKGHNQDGKLTVSADCEHISYRLNGSDYNLEYFTGSGTPATVLASILAGTGFNVGAVEFTAGVTYSIQEKMSRRAILVQFAEFLGGELLFNGFSVSILAQRGSSTLKDLLEGRNITVISKDVDKTRPDTFGNPTVAYECALVEPMGLTLGDAVKMAYNALDIDFTLRIVNITINPYNSSELSFAVSNTVPTIEDEAYEIATTTVTKDKTYNGCRIGPVYGFEVIQSDKKARAYFRSDEMKFQTGDGSGSSWTDKLYYGYDREKGNTELYFNGKFTADVIEALSAIITPNLYAGKATIAELTVDQLDTSDMIRNYLAHKTNPVKYIRVYDQNVEFHLAKTTGSTAEHAIDRNGNRLYWTDDTHTVSTTEDTGLPVMQYVYETDQIKLRFSFEYSSESSEDEPMLVLGVGTGEGDNGKAFIWKKTTGLAILQKNSTGDNVEIDFTADGIVCFGNTGVAGIRNIGYGTVLPTTGQFGDLFVKRSS